MVALPRLVLIADRFTQPEVAERTAAAVEAGVGWVQLRDRAGAPDLFERAAAITVDRLRAASDEVLLSINTRLDLAERLETGLHVGRGGPSLAEARKRLAGRPLGFSAHAVEEAGRAVAGGADYLFFSPIFPTASKPGQPGAGVPGLRTFCAAFPETPVYALGGITPERVQACIGAGAYGIAVLSGILEAPDPASAVRDYLDALEKSIHRPPSISHHSP